MLAHLVWCLILASSPSIPHAITIAHRESQFAEEPEGWTEADVSQKSLERTSRLKFEVDAQALELSVPMAPNTSDIHRVSADVAKTLGMNVDEVLKWPCTSAAVKHAFFPTNVIGPLVEPIRIASGDEFFLDRSMALVDETGGRRRRKPSGVPTVEDWKSGPRPYEKPLNQSEVVHRGGHKYVLFRACTEGKGGTVQTPCQHFVRSYQRLNTPKLDEHLNIFSLFVQEVSATMQDAQGKGANMGPPASICALGGGRILNSGDSVLVFGFSSHFKPCKGCNEAVASFIAQNSAKLGIGSKGVDWTNSGY